MDKEKSSTEVARYLTDSEINQVLSRLAPPQIAITEIREHVYKKMKEMYKYQMEMKKFKPSKLEKLGDFIANKSERSYYSPGTPVGFNVAEAIGEPATQLVLKSIHTAGLSSQNPFARFKELVSLRPYKKNAARVNMKIHMYDKNISYESLYVKSQQFVTVSLSDLLEQGQIIKETYPFEDMSMYTEEFKKLNSYEDYGYAIRLRFDREKLFLHQIPLESIAIKLSRIEGGSLFSLFYGPQIEGVIDIYPIPRAICSGNDSNENISKSFFQECCNIFENGQLKTIIQGIKLGEYNDISFATVSKIPVINLIMDVTPDFDNPEEESKTHVRVWINWVYAKKEGVPIEKLQELLTLTGHNIEGEDTYGNYFIVESPDINVKERISKQLKEEDAKLIQIFSDTKKLVSSPLYLAGYYNFISTIGSNLAEVRIHPEVDEFHTISDNTMEIYEVLGIEVARAYLEKSIFDLFTENSHNISPRNITIIVDWMTAGIKPISANPKNVYKSDNSVMRAVSFEDPKTGIVKGATLSTEESLGNVSARILFGAKQKMGTGAFEIIEDPEVMELYDRLTSENDVGAFRLTSDTLKKIKPKEKAKVPISRRNDAVGAADENQSFIERSYQVPIGSAIPAAASDLFSDDDLSKGSDIGFML